MSATASRDAHADSGLLPEDRQTVAQLRDPVVRAAARGALHVRRYQPFYVFSLVWLLMLALFPSVNPLGDRTTGGFAADGSDFSSPGFADDGTGFAAPGASQDGSTVDGTLAGSGGGSATVAGGSTGGRSSGGGVPTAGGGTTGPRSTDPGPTGDGGGPGTTAPPPTAAPASGKTRGLGVDCNGGDVRQIPWSLYAAPCVPRYDGPNGGSTYRGVTDTEILVVWRTFPDTANSRAVDAVLVQAGFADPEVTENVFRDWISFFNANFEFYGRQIKLVEYESENGNSTDEAQSKGKEGACLDADKIAKEFQAFAVGPAGTSGPFGECAAERGLVSFRSGPYFPESWYRRYHPFLYETLMECERISHQVSEYIVKRLNGRPAKWAKDAIYQTQNRKFGTYVPDNDEYQHCVRIAQDGLKAAGVDPGPTYNYILDVSRFADEAAKGVIQFKAAGVTTLILACDPISVIFLTQQARTQNWGPEWFIIGVAGQDTDNFGRLYDQDRVDGHLFGMSQLGAITQLIGPTSEAGESYRSIPRDLRTYDDMPEGTNGGYYDWLHMANGIQLAGPTLTPENIFAGYCQRYGTATGPAGLWRFNQNPDGSAGCDHTAIDDSREVYWDGSATAPDGSAGTFLETYGGRRFANGEWPAEEPPVYPGG